MMGTPIWTTKDKHRIPISEMADSHLLNAHRFMCRQMREVDKVDREQGKFTVAIGPGAVTLELRMLGMIGKVKELEEEIERRGLEALVAMPQTEVWKQLERDIVRAQYKAYCS